MAQTSDDRFTLDQVPRTNILVAEGKPLGWTVTFLLCLGCVAPVSVSPAQTLATTSPLAPAVTNIAQLRALAGSQWRFRCTLELTGTVCAVSTAKSVVALADESGAEVFVLDFQGRDLRVGQTLVLSAPDCEVTRRPTELVLRRAPLVDHDGRHAPTDKSASVALGAGRHPFRLEWFNATGPATLEVEFTGPGTPRQKIPDELFWRRRPEAAGKPDELVPGLEVRGFEGNWEVVPDFGDWPVAKSGVMPNCDRDFGLRAENIGLEFSGFFEAAASGIYTFHVRSDDGSRLFFGAPMPRLREAGAGNLPPLRKLFIGQVVGPLDAYRWTQAEGEARHMVSRAGRLELELQARAGNRMQVVIADDAGLPAQLLLNSQIRVAGVSRDVLIPGGQRVFGLLSAVSRREVQLVTVATEVWAAFPVTTIAELSEPRAWTNPPLARLAGTLRSPPAAQSWLLTDQTGEVLVEPGELGRAFFGKDVEVIGVCQRVGTNWVLQNPGFRLRPAAEEDLPAPLPVLTTAEQVLRLGREEAGRAHPVRLRGVITCIWPDYQRNVVIQDGTRGVFTSLPAPDQAGSPRVGEFWEMAGVTAPGIFSPMVEVQRMTRLSEGRMPAPVQPTWDQLLNGSLDALFVEIEGVIIDVDNAKINLLTQWGKVTVEFFGERPAALDVFKNKLVRIRGCLLAVWDQATHQVKVGEVRLGSATISTDELLAADPFAAPFKSVGEMLQFDIQAGSFHRVRMAGQIVAERAGEFFMMSGTNGVRFVPREPSAVRRGDLVEVAGIPELGGPAPVLREAFVRPTGHAALPAPKRLSPEQLWLAANDATRVQVEGVVVNRRNSREEQLLELQSGLGTFTARLRERDGLLPPIALRSTLALTGVYAAPSGRRVAGQPADNFELLLGSVQEVTVLARPPWWTLRRLLAALGILVVVLAGAMLWVLQLRRRVEAQTEIIRETVQQTATLEERSRIARELHDTLEQALAGVSFQLGALAGTLRRVSPETMQMLERARSMVRHGQEEARRSVRNLRVLSLEHGNLADALARMVKDAVNGLPVKIEVRVQGEPVTLSNQVENHLLRISQEAMTNALKHARAQNIRFELTYLADQMQLQVADDGCGFEVAETAPTEAGHFGLLGMRERANKIGGVIQIGSQPGAGTTVSVQVPFTVSNSNPELS